MSRIVALIAAAGIAGVLATSAQAAPLSARTVAVTAPGSVVLETSAVKKKAKKKARRHRGCPY